jgi:hypothetical protein
MIDADEVMADTDGTDSQCNTMEQCPVISAAHPHCASGKAYLTNKVIESTVFSPIPIFLSI